MNTSVGVPLPSFVIASEAKQSSAAVSLRRSTKLARIAPLDCFVALLLAMTRHNPGAGRVAGTRYCAPRDPAACPYFHVRRSTC